ncbi:MULTISPECIES: preprotein translocase subunit YajC [Acidithiobacillus]|uniref:Sec translocon accessory complex subunit YajC n=2 Tax=Acidithiobacillus TaxID=119977 RepID=A0A179B684_ACIFR|nr:MULTISPECIES: preprotein translocase subunit YajC [Acidithiobacillus]MEB8488260.1 preprotein translocase subunit YajC [Acidithiobacillus ferriphilus]MEB8489419.1 preprotein translocase subunit YajC [Acidithiobacillus ferriphilus]MEB8492122.1 preprotein translocase subunit YajC [Acidithiobacillus ferriphilus]MEB8514741.1 preprotein translocase subunit YajC [Acidithiobacillus ferriphilus]MEB8520526.1 preprotein translocase subunit YajC [Acidithiobacillus ferriphilus]
MNFSPIANAYAGTAVGEGGPDSIFMQIVPLVIIFAIFYFLLIRPQMKKAKEQRQLIAAISKGDEVVTQGSLAGRVMQVGEDYLQLEIAEGVIVKVQRASVTLLLPKGTLKKL